MLPLIVLFLFGFQPVQTTQVVAAPDHVRIEKLQRKALDYLSEHRIEVEFTGNEALSTEELLALLASDGNALEYLPKGAQSPDDLDTSLHLFRKRLATRGYLQASFGETKIEQTVAGHKFIIPVNEGARFRIGKVSFEGGQLLSPEQLSEMFPLKQGDVANASVILTFLCEQLKNIYSEHGYLQYVAEPEPTYHLAPNSVREGIVDFQITIEEGIRFNVLSVEFVGNQAIPDWVIRPALRLREDEPFRESLLVESLKNIEELNLFEEIFIGRDVDYAFDEEHGLVMIKISLKEKNQP